MATGFTVDGTFVRKTFVLQRFCSTLQVPPGKKKNLAKTFVFKRFLAPVSWLCQEKKLQKTFVFKRFLEYRQHLPRKKVAPSQKPLFLKGFEAPLAEKNRWFYNARGCKPDRSGCYML